MSVRNVSATGAWTRDTRRLAVFGTVAAAVACTGSTELVTPPPPPTADVTLSFVPHPEDQATAAALGWAVGIPGMLVTITPTDSSLPNDSLQTDESGRVALDLEAGAYILEAYRWLTADETAQLPTGDDALGFAGRWEERISASRSQALETPASRKKGLIISEWSYNHDAYDFGGFVELFNNGDTTVYVDGMVYGQAWDASLDAPILPCAQQAAFRDDPMGVWSRLWQVFPGSGREHPVEPGATVLVATDAIDHRPFAEYGLDLRHARFEMTGAADVDNPGVPNMIESGLVAFPLGHGLLGGGSVQVPFLALPVDPASLIRAAGPGGNSQWARIPAERVLDVVAIRSNYPAGFADCPPLVNARFDRRGSAARGTQGTHIEVYWSLHRRRLPTDAGRIRYQWTRSGFADFLRTMRSPGAP